MRVGPGTPLLDRARGPTPSSLDRGRLPPPPVFDVCVDFDGTLVEPNVAILLVSEFVPNGPAIAHEVDELLRTGAITLRQAWERQSALLPAARIPEMVEFVQRRIPLRAGARKFLGRLAADRVPVHVVSGGLDFYIRAVLEREGFSLPFFADRLVSNGPGALQVIHPHGHPTCRLCGICKALIARPSGPARTSVYVGDGATDRYAAEVADVVFARHRLLEYCRRTGIPHYPFEVFDSVTRQFDRWLTGAEPLPDRRRLGDAGSPCPESQRLASEGREGLSGRELLPEPLWSMGGADP